MAVADRVFPQGLSAQAERSPAYLSLVKGMLPIVDMSPAVEMQPEQWELIEQYSPFALNAGRLLVESIKGLYKGQITPDPARSPRSGHLLS